MISFSSLQNGENLKNSELIGIEKGRWQNYNLSFRIRLTLCYEFVDFLPKMYKMTRIKCLQSYSGMNLSREAV